MIEFNGDLSGKAREFAKNRQMKQGILATILAFFFILAIMPFLNAIFGSFCWPMLFAPLSVMLYAFMPYFPSSQRELFPKSASIDFEESCIKIETYKYEVYASFKDVKAVRDYGEWYYFVNKSSSCNLLYFILQKDLLVSGTLEEIEEAFSDKIVRMV